MKKSHFWMALMLIVALFSAKADRRGDQVDALFTDFRHGLQPGAAVMVIEDGVVVHAEGYGYADLERTIAITPDSTFRLGSVSKQFTAMAVAQLADHGRLDLDAPAMRYVPALATYPDVTVRHLIVHSSGLPDYYDVIDTSAWEAAGEMPDNGDVIDYVGRMQDPQFEPGERYEYSNPAYEALPLVVEAITGQPFADYMSMHFFRPLGMDNSLIHDHRQPQIPRRVMGYAQDGGGFVLDDADILNGITGSGGQYSTLEDFVAWDQALYGGDFFSEALLEEAFTRAKTNDGHEYDYGLGFRLDEYRGHRRIAHGGSWVGFNTAISRFPDQKLTVVILSNRAEYDPVAVSDRVADIYLD